MCEYIYIYIYTCIYFYIFMCVYIYICICVSLCIAAKDMTLLKKDQVCVREGEGKRESACVCVPQDAQDMAF